jgi:hypothetical protein
MKEMLLRLGFVGLLLLGLGEVRAGSVFDFEDVPVGTSTPFSETNNGVTASFSSPADPGGFTITPSFWAPPIVGNVLFDPGPSGASSIPLDVVFSSPITSVSLDFATDGDSPFNLVTAVGSASATGSVPSGFSFPQGSISFSSATPFTAIELSASDAPFFAVDNISITSASVPEPGSLALLGLGVLGALGYAWRRRSRAS